MRGMGGQVSAAAAFLFIYVLLFQFPGHVRSGVDPMLEPFALALVPFVLVPVLAISAIVRERKSLRVPLAAVAVLTAWLFFPGTAYMAGYIAHLLDRAVS